MSSAPATDGLLSRAATSAILVPVSAGSSRTWTECAIRPKTPVGRSPWSRRSRRPTRSIPGIQLWWTIRTPAASWTLRCSPGGTSHPVSSSEAGSQIAKMRGWSPVIVHRLPSTATRRATTVRSPTDRAWRSTSVRLFCSRTRPSTSSIWSSAMTRSSERSARSWTQRSWASEAAACSPARSSCAAAYSRMVSSARKRALPSSSESTSSDCSTSTSTRSAPSGPSTVMAVRRSNPSWKIDNHESARCSSAASRSHDQAMTASSVRCRSGVLRSRVRSAANRSSSAAATSATVIVRTRAAASSTASGSPSSRSTTSRTDAGSRTASGRVADARRTNSSSASRVESWLSGTARSAASRSGARLVASTWRSRVVASRKATSAATGSSTCSQLSSTSRVGPASSSRAIRPRTSACWAGVSASRVAIDPRTPRAAPTAATTSSPAPTPTSSTTCTCGRRDSRASTWAMLVLPMPPGPSTVTSRDDASALRSRARSWSRPSSRSPSYLSPVRTGSSAARSSRCRCWSSGAGSTPSRSARSSR